jgi:hypothetical protein
MQQVFDAINLMLKTEPKTKKRRLLMKTYKVVPVSQRSGVIEWCENTQTFGDYLVGNGTTSGAHVMYRPTDSKPSECRKLMSVCLYNPFFNFVFVVYSHCCHHCVCLLLSLVILKKSNFYTIHV